jgi:hypothetical protein
MPPTSARRHAGVLDVEEAVLGIVGAGVDEHRRGDVAEFCVELAKCLGVGVGLGVARHTTLLLGCFGWRRWRDRLGAGRRGTGDQAERGDVARVALQHYGRVPHRVVAMAGVGEQLGEVQSQCDVVGRGFNGSVEAGEKRVEFHGIIFGHHPPLVQLVGFSDRLHRSIRIG